MNSALDEIYKGLGEVKRLESERDMYKARCETLGKKLLDSMMKVYEMTPFEVRKEQHQARMCVHCRKHAECNGAILDNDVMKPMMYYGGIPDYSWCLQFDWDD